MGCVVYVGFVVCFVKDRFGVVIGGLVEGGDEVGAHAVTVRVPDDVFSFGLNS